MKAIGYLRISTKDQSHHSLEYQEKAIREYCDRNNVELISIFTDDGESSYTFDRPDYKALENFIRQHKGGVKYLVVLDHDRFSRNLPEALLKIEQLEKKFGIKVVATNESLDIDPGDPSVFMMRAFKYLVANQELFTIRRRAKLGIRQAQLSGRYVNMAPFGYVNAKQSNGKGIMTIDEKKAFIVKKIFKDYLAGIPHYLIYKEVVKLGFPNKGNGAIARILDNPVYAGLVRVTATEKEPEKIIKGLHEGIVTPQEYWRAQALLHDKRSMKSQPKEEFPLKGILKSSCCGTNMTAGWSKGEYKYYMYYRCIKHSNNNVSGSKVHKKFDELLEHLNFTEEQVSKIEKNVLEGLKEASAARQTQFNYKKEQLSSIKTKIENLEEKFINNEINNETYTKWTRKFNIENARISEELNALGKDVDEQLKEQIRLLPNLMQFDKIYHQATLKQQHTIINQTFKHGLVFTGSGFRTFSINPALSHNLLKMNEKGLLFVEQPSEYSDKLSSCAEEEIRTPKPLRALPPQSSASTNFATSAMGCKNKCFLH